MWVAAKIGFIVAVLAAMLAAGITGTWFMVAVIVLLAGLFSPWPSDDREKWWHWWR